MPVDVQQPDGRRWEYHVVRLRHLAVAAVVNDRQEVLMMWCHRFITDSWAWELPMGLVEEGEPPEQAAAREVHEETGWRPGPVKPLIYVGPPTEKNESDRIDWIPLSEVRGMIDRREVVSSGSLVGLPEMAGHALGRHDRGGFQSLCSRVARLIELALVELCTRQPERVERAAPSVRRSTPPIPSPHRPPESARSGGALR